MKYIKTLLTVLSIGCVVGKTKSSNLDKCSEELAEYSDCLFDYIQVSDRKQDDYCKNNYYSENCQNFVSNPREYLPSCASNTELLKNIESKIKVLNLVCTATQIHEYKRNEYCELSRLYIDYDNERKNEMNLINLDSKYEQCYYAYLAVLYDKLTRAKEAGDEKEINAINKRINYFNTDTFLKLSGKKQKSTTTTSSSSRTIVPHPTSIQKTKNGSYCDVCVFEPDNVYTLPNPEGKDLQEIIKESDCFMYGMSYCCDGIPSRSINKIELQTCGSNVTFFGKPVPEYLGIEIADPTDLETSKSLCEKEYSLYKDCTFEYKRKSEEDIVKGCEIFSSKRCQRFFEDPYRYAPNCFFASIDPLPQFKNNDKLYQTLNSVCHNVKSNSCTYDDPIYISSDDAYYLKYVDFSSTCEKKDTTVEITPNEIDVELTLSESPSQFEKDVYDCQTSLDSYDECFFNFFNLTTDELLDKCEIYKSKKCQDFVSDPWNVVPSCNFAGQYEMIRILSKVDELRKTYSGICSDNKIKTCTYRIFGGISDYALNPILITEKMYSTKCNH